MWKSFQAKFNMFRNPFISQYIQAWQDGFDEGYRQGMETALEQQKSGDENIHLSTDLI